MELELRSYNSKDHDFKKKKIINMPMIQVWRWKKNTDSQMNKTYTISADINLTYVLDNFRFAENL